MARFISSIRDYSGDHALLTSSYLLFGHLAHKLARLKQIKTFLKFRRIGDGLGAGGILSTANDMAKYGAFHLNKGKVGDRQVVSAVSVFFFLIFFLVSAGKPLR